MSSSEKRSINTDVLIVGAGPAGAATSALLATYGVDNLMINKYGAVAPTPRAHITNQRSMEVLRDLDLEERALRFAVPQEQMGEHVYSTSMVDEELGRVLTWYNHPKWKADHDLASPCSICDIPQTEMEPLLVHAASDRGSKVRFNTEYLSMEQDSDGVTVTLLDRLDGEEYQVRCKYLVAADGARSKIVDDIDLDLKGAGGLGGSISIFFEGDLTRYVEHRQGDMYWMIKSGVGLAGAGIGVLRMVKPWNQWIATGGYKIENGPPELDEKTSKEIVYELIGERDVDINILHSSTWQVNDIHASEIIRGRVLAMGDAIHRHPPMNGLGSNTCLGDAYNLAWKLAFVLDGRAEAGLLQSYEDERVPVGAQIVERANKSMALVPKMIAELGIKGPVKKEELFELLKGLKDPSEAAAKKRKAVRQAMDGTVVGFNTLGAELNQRYTSSAIIGDGSKDPGFPLDKDLHHQPNSRPGSHLPHAWLLHDQAKVSTFDICGKGAFTLLTGLSGQASWSDAADKVASQLGVTINVHAIGPGQPYQDMYGDFARMTETDESGALLVRPDMVIGWRAKSASESSKLTNTIKAILAR